MSWFFGKKKEEKKEPTAQDIAKEKQMEKERDNYEIEKNIEKQDATLKKFEAKINELDRKVEAGGNVIFYNM